MSSFLPYSDSFSTKVDGFTRHVNASSRRRLLQKEIQNIHGMSVISAVLQTKVSVFTIPRRSVVEVTYRPAIHRAGQLGLQIAVSGPPLLDATEMKPSSVTNCLTAIPVGFTPCSMNCIKRLLDAVPYRNRSAAPKAIFCHTDQATCLCHLDRARHVERSFDYEMTT